MPEHVLVMLQGVRVTHILVCLPWLMLLAWLAGVAGVLVDGGFLRFL